MSTRKEVLIGTSRGLRAQAGQTLIEIIVAMGIFSIVISATLLVFFGGQKFVAQSVISSRAIQYAHDGAEAMRLIRDTDWPSLADGSYDVEFVRGFWRLTTTIAPNSDGFTRTITITSDPVTKVKTLHIVVAWSYPPQPNRTIDMYATITPPADWLVGDWRAPCLYAASMGVSIPFTIYTDLDYANSKVFVSSNTTLGNNADLFVFDVTNPKAPAVLSTLDVEQGWGALAVLGNYLFAGEAGYTDFFVVDITNTAAPVKIAKMTFVGAGNPTSVAVSGNYAYIGTTYSIFTPELFIVDISNPATPTLVGSLDLWTDVNDVSVLFNKVYLATSDPNKELTVVDASNHANPTVAGFYNAPGTMYPATAVDAKSVDRIYFGRRVSVFTDKELFILDATNPASITPLGSTDTSTNIRELKVVGPLTFLGMNDTNNELRIYNTGNPLSISSYGNLNLPSYIAGMDFENNFLYAAPENFITNSLFILTSTVNIGMGLQCGRP